MENDLRNIRYACRDAIDDATGAVNVAVIAAQAQTLKAWIAEFEKGYIADAKRRPTRADAILIGGHKLCEDAWFCCELLWNAEIEAGGPAPVAAKWENLPHGVVFGEVKAEMLTAMSDLLADYRSFRRDILKS